MANTIPTNQRTLRLRRHESLSKEYCIDISPGMSCRAKWRRLCSSPCKDGAILIRQLHAFLGGTMPRPSGNFSVVERRLNIEILLPIQKDCHVAFKVRRQKHSLRLVY